MDEPVGDKFHQETKYARHTMSGGWPSRIRQPELYKIYPKSKKIQLSHTGLNPRVSLYQTLETRRSIRSFTAKPISLEELSYLLWASTGIQRREQGYEFRTAPSAGALYPIETYLLINHVETLKSGIYHYSIKDHALEELQLGDFRHDLSQAALGQDMCAQAAAVFIWTAVFDRSKWKYNQRAYRYIYLDAGHIAENLALAATGLTLGSCHIGALFDDEVNDIIAVDGVEESVVYMTGVGNPGTYE